jgi:hypothetical protein
MGVYARRYEEPSVVEAITEIPVCALLVDEQR